MGNELIGSDIILKSILFGILSFLSQLAATFSIAKGSFRCEFAPTEFNVLHWFFNGELEWLEIGSLVACIAERLFETHAATAPSVNLIIDLGMFDQDWASEWRHRLQCLISSLPVKLSFYFSMRLDLEMRLIMLTEWLGGVLWLDDPRLRCDLFDLFEIVASGPKQHNYYLI